MELTVNIQYVSGLTVRWYRNGWQYFTFPNRYRVVETVRTTGKQVTMRYSTISRTEKPIRKEYDRVIIAGHDMLTGVEYQGLKSILSAQIVEAFLSSVWNGVEVKRGSQSTTEKGYQYTIELEMKLDEAKIDYY